MLSASGHRFEELCVPLRGELVNFARRLTRWQTSDAAAEDIVQDALMKAWSAWADFSPDGMEPGQAARAWLYRIVGNRHANAFRDICQRHKLLRRQVTKILGALYGDVDNLVSQRPPSDPERPSSDFLHRREVFVMHQPDNNDIAAEVMAAVARLSPKRREAITRYYFLGDSCETIGAALDVPASSVRSLLMRARTKLAPLLERYARMNYELAGGIDTHVEPPKRRKPKPGGIERIVTQPHRRTLRSIELAPDQLTARAS